MKNNSISIISFFSSLNEALIENIVSFDAIIEDLKKENVVKIDNQRRIDPEILLKYIVVLAEDFSQN